MPKRDGFTLIEVLVTLVIISTLVALTWPNYVAIKEKSLNREAKASLALIRAAEKIYKMEQGFYYPNSATENDVSQINSFLKLSLPASASVNWAVNLNSAGSATATRNGSDGRVWSINFPGEVDPTCSGGAACP